MKTHHRSSIVALAAVTLMTVGQSKADVIVTVSEAGGNVVWSSSGGAFDLTGLTFDGSDFGTGRGQGFSDPVHPSFVVGGGSPVDYWGGVTAPANFGTGSTVINFTGSTGTGYGASDTHYGIPSDAILVPTGYSSGDALGAATSTYAGESFATMGLAEGTYVWAWGQGGANQTLTLNIIPAPATAGLLGLAAIGFGCSRRRK